MSLRRGAQPTRRPAGALSPMPSETSRGFGLIELLIVVAIVAVLATINVPAVIRARAAANETSAIASLRTINNAQRVFAATCADGWFAATLDDLGTPPPGESQPFLAPELAQPGRVVKNGYRFALGGLLTTGAPSDACNRASGGPSANQLVSGYVATATPEGSFSGTRHFWTNTTGALFQKAEGGTFRSLNVAGPPADDREAQAVSGERADQRPPPAGQTVRP